MSAAAAERRIVHVWLPFLATDRLARLRRNGASTPSDEAGRPVPRATVAKVRGALILAAVDRVAQDNGLAAGLPLAEARAQVPDLVVDPADPGADAEGLRVIARAADRYTPLVGLDPPAGLFLDVTGCAHLFGGEAALLDDIVSRHRHWGFSARAAVAGSPALAWAVARWGSGGVVPAGSGGAALASLSIEALRLPQETTAVLVRLGLKTVAQLLRQPRAPLVQRFGPLLARRIDQAEGRESEPITPLSPVAPFVAERRFAEPLMQMEAVEATLAVLADNLTQTLRSKGKGARRFGLKLFHADGVVREVVVGASEPLADAQRIANLIRPRLDALSGRIESESGIDLLRLYAQEPADLVAWQTDMDGMDAAIADFARLVDTLSERLGVAAVQRFVEVDTHQPGEADARRPARDHMGRTWSKPQGREPPAKAVPLGNRPDRLNASNMPRAAETAPTPADRCEPFLMTRHPDVPASGEAQAAGSDFAADTAWSETERQAYSTGPSAGIIDASPPRRPLRLFTPPEPVEAMASVPDGPPIRFRWRRVFYHVAAAEGPERIAPSWWQADGPTLSCDYFRVEDVDGRRFWLFRQGLYGVEAAEPRWFIHGLFA